MRISRVYYPDKIELQQTVELDQNASHHLSKVLRVKVGDQVILFNGDPYFYHGSILEISRQFVRVSVASKESAATESPLHTHIGQVLSRGDRMDYAIQKAVELGVTEMTPLWSERCEVKIHKDKLEKKRLHGNK